MLLGYDVVVVREGCWMLDVNNYYVVVVVVVVVVWWLLHLAHHFGWLPMVHKEFLK